MQGDGLDIQQLKNLVCSVHRTVSLGHQRGPHAYSGEDFGRYLAEAARDCRQIMGLLETLAARQTVRIYGCCAQLEGELHTADCLNMRPLVAARQPVGDVQSNPLLAIARRNIRQFLAKATFASEMDRFSAGQCVDVMEAAIGTPPSQAMDLGHARVIELLLTVAEAAYTLADNANDMEDCEHVEHADFVALSDALDALDELPDDQPGYTMSEPAKARWALRALIGGQVVGNG